MDTGNNILQCITIKNNTGQENNARTKMIFLHPHPLRLHVSNNSNMLYDRWLPKEFVTAFIVNVSHLSGAKMHIGTGNYPA